MNTPRDISIKTVLISGACGVTSRTIVRALRASSYFKDVTLIGTDICENAYGLYEGLYDRIYKVPRYDMSAEYSAAIKHICQIHEVDAALFVPEPEVIFWTQHQPPVATFLPPPVFSRYAISKARLYQALSHTDLIPNFMVLERNSLLAGSKRFLENGKSFWMRDVGEGSTSGKGALKISHSEEAAAWLVLNPDTPRFMVSEYLPGRNLACILIYYAGQLTKIGCYERLEYFMSKTTASGVSGNISVGRLINDPDALTVATSAVEYLCNISGESMQGAVTVDLCGDAHNKLKVTEINLRQVAAASAFAQVQGANLAEAQLLLTLGRAELVGPKEVLFPLNNRILRDIDGLPLLVPDYRALKTGECIIREQTT